MALYKSALLLCISLLAFRALAQDWQLTFTCSTSMVCWFVAGDQNVSVVATDSSGVLQELVTFPACGSTTCDTTQMLYDVNSGTLLIASPDDVLGVGEGTISFFIVLPPQADGDSYTVWPVATYASGGVDPVVELQASFTSTFFLTLNRGSNSIATIAVDSNTLEYLSTNITTVDTPGSLITTIVSNWVRTVYMVLDQGLGVVYVYGIADTSEGGVELLGSYPLPLNQGSNPDAVDIVHTPTLWLYNLVPSVNGNTLTLLYDANDDGVLTFPTSIELPAGTATGKITCRNDNWPYIYISSPTSPELYVLYLNSSHLFSDTGVSMRLLDVASNLMYGVNPANHNDEFVLVAYESLNQVQLLGWYNNSQGEYVLRELSSVAVPKAKQITLLFQYY